MRFGNFLSLNKDLHGSIALLKFINLKDLLWAFWITLIVLSLTKFDLSNAVASFRFASVLAVY